MRPGLQIWAVPGIPEVRAGDDLAALIVAADPQLRDGDVVVVTSKAVSKAEGRLVPGSREDHLAAESVRVVAARGPLQIVETRHGFVMAAAGIDASNVPDGCVALLPLDPDRSAAAIRDGLRAALAVDVAVLVSDTMGRPWREGVTDVAIGAAGIEVLDDMRGRSDPAGHVLEATVVAVADELAAATDLVKGKLAATPVAVVRGLAARGDPDGRGARPLVRAGVEDMFRLGTAEAKRQVVADTVPVPAVDAAVDPAAVLRAIAAVENTGVRLEPAGDGRILVTGTDPVAAGVAVGRLLAALAAEDLRAEWPVPAPAGVTTALRVGRREETRDDG